MKLWPWAILLIGIIGVAAAAAIVTLTEPGSVTVVTPALVWTDTANLAFGSITVIPTGPAVTAIQSFTLKNTGGLPLTIGYSCTCPTGLSLVLGSPLDISGTVLATGATITGTVSLTIQPTTAPGALSFTLTIDGS